MRKNNYINTIYVLVAIIVVESIFLIASFQRKDIVVRKAQKQEEKIERLEGPAKGRIYQGKIAIVLDDWGYTLNNFGMLKEIKEPLTLAILPGRSYSREIARASSEELTQEAILHLPLEPHRGKNNHLEPDTILLGMSEQEVLKILKADFNSVPGIKGVSNHMGSLATENKRLMKIILGELKKRKLYFLDSYTGKTVCKDLAGAMGLRYARRHVFLDNKNDAEYIFAQIEVLARIAKQAGYAIGIGHDRPRTLEVLSKAMPDLKKRGFKFVYVSELVK